MKITIWNELPAEKERSAVKRAYPEGMSEAIAQIFRNNDNIVTISSQNLDYDGLSEKLLQNTDILIYWAHCLHDKLKDETVERIAKRVNEGMGVIFLHSAHFSKPFKKIMGTSGSLKWREDGKHERIYNINPHHPIANGIPEKFVIHKEEMYGEYFDIPTPDDIVFLGWYPRGEIFRSGFTYHYGKGKVFYFQPGHETYPVYYNEYVRKIILNAARWAVGINVNEETTFIKPTCTYARSLECKFGRPKI